MQRLQVDYANYLLEFPWQAYYTQTFRSRRHDVHNSIQSTWQKLYLKLGWTRSFVSKLGWTRSFVSAERHKLGGVHLHYLLANDYDYEPWTMIMSLGNSKLRVAI